MKGGIGGQPKYRDMIKDIVLAAVPSKPESLVPYVGSAR